MFLDRGVSKLEKFGEKATYYIYKRKWNKAVRKVARTGSNERKIPLDKETEEPLSKRKRSNAIRKGSNMLKRTREVNR